MYRFCCILLLLPYLLTSCQGKDAEKAAAGQEALASYREHVTAFAQDSLSETELRALHQAENDSLAWEKAKANLRQEYETQRERLQQHQEHLTPAERTEAEQLDQTYHNALGARQLQFEDASLRYKLRRELLGMEVKEDDMSSITPDNIGPTFQRFVSAVERNAASYQNREWLLIQGWWSALNSRYRELENQIPQGVKKTVAQAQNQYRQVQPSEEVSGQETQKPQP